MQLKKILCTLACFSSVLHAQNREQPNHLEKEIKQLQIQTKALQTELERVQKKLAVTRQSKKTIKRVVPTITKHNKKSHDFHTTPVIVHTPETNPEAIGFYPTALVAENNVVTYIAGTPVVSSPYLGDRPAFDGSDYIVNISSINRDIRLMQQRRRLYRAYRDIGYPVPQMPIIALSGKAEPAGVISQPYNGNANTDFTLGSGELDVAATVNQNVEAYISLSYDESPPEIGPRIDNSAFSLNMGFVNIGNLDKTPFYFTAGQMYVPFGRYSSAMISSPLTLSLARTKARPFILGYHSQESTGLFAAIYGYKSDTTLGRSGVGGANLGYIFKIKKATGEIGVSYISSIDDAAGMQSTGSRVGTTFGGFGSLTNGNEWVRKTQALDVHANLAWDRYNLAGEWVGAIEGFRPQDLSFNNEGARPQAVHTELDVTFRAFDRPSSVGFGYQWTSEALALNLPKQRLLGVFNISIWKDTVESIEYRHDIDYKITQFANGAAPLNGANENTIGTGKTADTVSLQIGVYF